MSISSSDNNASRPVRTLPIGGLVDESRNANEHSGVASGSSVDQAQVSVLSMQDNEKIIRNNIEAELTDIFEKKYQARVLENKKQYDLLLSKQQSDLAEVIELMNNLKATLESEIKEASEAISDVSKVVAIGVLDGFLSHKEKYADFVSDFLKTAITLVKPTDSIQISVSKYDHQLLNAILSEPFGAGELLVDISLAKGDAIVSFNSRAFRVSLREQIDRFYRHIITCLSDTREK